MKNFASTLVIALSFIGLSQKDVYLTFSHKNGNEAFAFNQTLSNNLGQNFEITRVDYYVSKIKIIHDGGQITELDNAKHLLIKGNANSVNHLGSFDLQSIEGITFSIGVHPSLNNADPALQTPGTPLAFQNPTMHWGWSSGYFFVCLEGKCGTTVPLNFQLHGLWNQNYFEQTIDVQAIENAEGPLYMHLDADYSEALKNININNCPVKHGSNEEDLTVLQNFRDFVFSAGDGSLLNIEDLPSTQNFSVFPNPAQNQLNLRFNNSESELTIKILDVYGREISTQTTPNNQLSFDVVDLQSGIYFVQLLHQNELLAQKRFVKN